MDTLSIGQVARRAGVGVETVRFYEREGLLEEPPRRASGYRQYSEQVVKRIHFIKRAQKLGFSLKEIAELLLLRVDAQEKDLRVPVPCLMRSKSRKHLIRLQMERNEDVVDVRRGHPSRFASWIWRRGTVLLQRAISARRSEKTTHACNARTL